MKDRIKTNCAACAYKHLTAAYACLPFCNQRLGTEYDGPMSEGTYVARAVIVLVEAANGYPAHTALATGCLTMAEQRKPKSSALYREFRAALSMAKNKEALLGIAHDLSLLCDDYEMFQAHLCEAVRELPELRVSLPPDNSDMTNAEWAEWFVETIAYVVETYELGTHDKLDLA